MTQKSKTIPANKTSLSIKKALDPLFVELSTGSQEYFPQNPELLKKMILQTSDQFLFKENKSQWNQKWFQVGYLNYFFPMQFSRIYKALQRVLEVAPHLESSISSVVDYGSGPGPAALAFQQLFEDFPSEWLQIDESEIAHKWARSIFQKFHFANSSTANTTQARSSQIKSQFQKSSQVPLSQNPNELIIFSYSLCEGIQENNMFTYDHIFILEPSTKNNSRRLIELRDRALQLNYSIIAPCTHCLDCPLYKRKQDWCHDQLERPHLNHLADVSLPFSDKKLNFSYLFLSKTLPSPQLSSQSARAVGNILSEKGKSKMSICKNDQRLFLSWLKRSEFHPTFGRGDLIKIPDNSLLKGQEIRISAD